MPGLSFYDRQHIEKLLQQEASLKYIFDDFVRKVGFHMSGWKDSDSENIWFRNVRVEKGVEKELQNLHGKLVDNIQKFSIDAWDRGNVKYDDLIESYIKDIPLNNVAKKGLFARNQEALNAFLNKKTNGETLSAKVWKITGTGKENIEHYLSSGIATGRPANLISQDVRQLLKEPDKRFRRIRNEEGKLVISAPMKDYHPGTGVYRSSFMNAKRLAATETNMAYRLADNERWQKLDFVLGVDVKRSASNKGPCPVCDSMVGKYPKDFVFKGWHPWCICVATPILMNEDAFIDSLIDDNWPVDEYVQDIPKDARNYLVEQSQKGRVTTNSYLFRDNKNFFDGTRGNVLKISQKLSAIQNIKSESGVAMVSFVPFSDLIGRKLATLKTKSEKQKLFREVLNDDSFKVLYAGEYKMGKTLLHPEHKVGSYRKGDWERTKQMAKDLNKSGSDVAFLPEQAEISGGDAITQFNKKYVLADFKYARSLKSNTIGTELLKGFKQSETIVLKMEKGNLDLFSKSIEQVKRNSDKVGNIILVNRYGKIFELSKGDLKTGRYKKKLKGFF